MLLPGSSVGDDRAGYPDQRQSRPSCGEQRLNHANYVVIQAIGVPLHAFPASSSTREITGVRLRPYVFPAIGARNLDAIR